MSTPAGQGPIGKTGNVTPEGYQQFQIQKFTPEQIQLLTQMMQNVSPDSYLGKLAGGDQSAFQEAEAPALRQFSAMQGNIGSRFSGMGTGGRKSSGFQNTMNQASSDFSQDLQSKRMKTRMDALRELMGFSNQLLGQQPYETGLVQEAQEPPGFFESVAGGIGGAIPGAIAGFAGGGPPGALAGAATGAVGGASGAIQRQAKPASAPYVPGSGNYGFENIRGF